MAEDNFDACVSFTLAQEGGFASLPGDAGGWTNFGITHITLSAWLDKPVTEQDVRDMPRSTAVAIYAAEYWNKLRCGELGRGVDLMVFDFGVNAGPANSARMLQKALGFSGDELDGWVGPETVKAANARPADALARSLSIMQAVYYRSLDSRYSAALEAREERRYARAKAMIGAGQAPPPAPAQPPTESTPPESTPPPAPAPAPPATPGPDQSADALNAEVLAGTLDIPPAPAS